MLSVVFWDLGAVAHCSTKIREEQLLKFIKILNYNKCSCITFVLNCFKCFQIYIILRRTETFWSRDVTIISVLAYFEFKIHKDFKYYIVSDIFKYIFWDKCPKKIRQEKNLNDIKMTWYSQRFLNSVKMTTYSQKRFQVLKRFNTLKLYTLKVLLS